MNLGIFSGYINNLIWLLKIFKFVDNLWIKLYLELFYIVIIVNNGCEDLLLLLFLYVIVCWIYKCIYEYRFIFNWGKIIEIFMYNVL